MAMLLENMQVFVRVVEQGSAAALFSQPRHPYTRELLGAIPALRLEEHLRVAGLGI